MTHLFYGSVYIASFFYFLGYWGSCSWCVCVCACSLLSVVLCTGIGFLVPGFTVFLVPGLHIIIYNSFSRKLSEPEDGRFSPKHVVFSSLINTII